MWIKPREIPCRRHYRVLKNRNGMPLADDRAFDIDADAFLLATFNFDIVGAGEATFALQTTDETDDETFLDLQDF